MGVALLTDTVVERAAPWCTAAQKWHPYESILEGVTLEHEGTMAGVLVNLITGAYGQVLCCIVVSVHIVNYAQTGTTSRMLIWCPWDIGKHCILLEVQVFVTF